MGIVAPPIGEAIQTLSAQWYNAIVGDLRLDPGTFQLLQSRQPLGGRSSMLWELFDTLPPRSIVHRYDPAATERFSEQYASIIHNLKPRNATTFLTTLSGYYQEWTSYLKADPELPPGGMVPLFERWAGLHVPDQTQRQQASTVYGRVASNVVDRALGKWLAAGGRRYRVKAYNNTLDALTRSLKRAPGTHIRLDNYTTFSYSGHTWAKGRMAGMDRFFAGDAGAGWDRLAAKLLYAGFSLDVHFRHITTFIAYPLANPSTDPGLATYQPWFHPPALRRAYADPGYTVWKIGARPNWNDIFGPEGRLQRACTALVAVDGIFLTLKSSVRMAESEKRRLDAAVKSGIWPFYKANGEGGWRHRVTFGHDDLLTITSHCEEGYPNILGVIATPIEEILGARERVAPP